MRHLLTSALLIALSVPSTARAQPAAQSWAAVDQALGRAGANQPDGVRRYSFPRSDLNVTLDGVRLKPGFAFGSWLAFQRTGNGAMVMGDLVLTDAEVNPVMTELLDGGIAITALHNHLLRSTPHTMYMHVEGHGDAAKLAAALHAALARSATPMQAAPAPVAAPLELDTAALDRIIGRPGKANGGVYQFGVPRPDQVTDGGMPVPATMGTGIGINFQPIGGGRTAITGDFVLREGEVNPVMRALRSAGIDITALHNHMLNDEPRLFFMHFWGTGDAQKLAAGLRAALDRVGLRQQAAEAER
jgi:hypothetical protein